MYTIYQHSNRKGHDFNSFKEDMIKICNSHRKNGKALAFAFILYDFDNATLRKVLNDQYYWDELDHISGKYLTVFSINYKPMPMFESSSYGRFSTVDSSFSPANSTNTLIEKYFGDGYIFSYPAILFFQVDDNEVVDSLLVELKEDRIEESFHELRVYIKNAVQSLQQIDPACKKNIKEVFDCLQRYVESTLAKRKIVRNLKKAGPVGNLILSILGLF